MPDSPFVGASELLHTTFIQFWDDILQLLIEYKMQTLRETVFQGHMTNDKNIMTIANLQCGGVKTLTATQEPHEIQSRDMHTPPPSNRASVLVWDTIAPTIEIWMCWSLLMRRG